MAKARVIHSKIIEDIRKRTSLKTRLNVTNEMLIQSYLVDQKFIPDGYWTEEKEIIYGHFREFAKQLTKVQMKEFKQWEKDGRPK
jgi:hypothetical protein